MKKLILIVLLLALVLISRAQKSSLSIEAGVLKSITKTQQINPTSSLHFAGFDSRIGGVAGLRYSYELSSYFNIGAELRYLLKGHATDYPKAKIFSNHYAGISPFVAFFPFAKAKSKYISCISPGLSFDYNYSLGTNAPWDKYSSINFYKSEMGYSLKLSYQPARLGIQVFHFSSLTPFLKSQWGFDDLKYNFANGVSILYKFGNRTVETQ